MRAVTRAEGPLSAAEGIARAAWRSSGGFALCNSIRQPAALRAYDQRHFGCMPRHRPVPTRETNRRKKAATPPQSPAAAERVPRGALLRPKVEQALADRERAIDEARADRGSGPLRVTTIASFLAQWLLPRLPDFTSHHAGIDVQIHTSTELVDFVKTGMDAAIRFGAGTWPRLHVQKLFDEWLVPVCTPALLQRHGPIAEARDLKRYRLLHSTYEPWTAWLLEGGPDEVWPSSGAAFDDAIAIVRAAQAGQGLALP